MPPGKKDRVPNLSSASMHTTAVNESPHWRLHGSPRRPSPPLFPAFREERGAHPSAARAVVPRRDAQHDDQHAPQQQTARILTTIRPRRREPPPDLVYARCAPSHLLGLLAPLLCFSTFTASRWSRHPQGSDTRPPPLDQWPECWCAASRESSHVGHRGAHRPRPARSAPAQATPAARCRPCLATVIHDDPEPNSPISRKRAS